MFFQFILNITNSQFTIQSYITNGLFTNLLPILSNNKQVIFQEYWKNLQDDRLYHRFGDPGYERWNKANE